MLSEKSHELESRCALICDFNDSLFMNISIVVESQKYPSKGRNTWNLHEKWCTTKYFMLFDVSEKIDQHASLGESTTNNWTTIPLEYPFVITDESDARTIFIVIAKIIPYF